MDDNGVQSMTDWILATQQLVLSIESAIKVINQQLFVVNSYLTTFKEKENIFYETAVRTDKVIKDFLRPVTVSPGGQPDDDAD